MKQASREFWGLFSKSCLAQPQEAGANRGRVDLKGESLCWRIKPAGISGVSDQEARGNPAAERGLMLQKIRVCVDDHLAQSGECKEKQPD